MYNTINYNDKSEKKEYVKLIVANHFGLAPEDVGLSEDDDEEFILDFFNSKVNIEAVTTTSLTLRDSSVDYYTKCIGDNDVFFRLI